MGYKGTQYSGDDKEIKELTGQIERITYSDAESGYAVLRIAVKGYPDLVTAVGTIASPAVGEVLSMKGLWTDHPKFGSQFKIVEYRSFAPSSIQGIEKYLGSGLIKGIGPSIAEKIVSLFGAEAFKILDTKPEKLLEIEGIGDKKAAAIHEAWLEQREMRGVMLFLQSYGIGTGYALRVFRHYGSASVQVLQENPYRLAVDIFGIGFVTADKIASSMGFSKESPLRIRAGVLHVINELTRDGHVFVPIEELTASAAEILSVSPELVEKGIEDGRLNQELIIEWYTDIEGKDDCAVYLPPFHYAEVHSAKNLCRILSSPFNGQYAAPDVVIPWVQQELGISFAGQQTEALKTALSSQVMVITGGPGTGKTTLIKAIIKIRSARGFRIMLAAPTGRAAKRMTEATGHEAKTIHRMLEYTGSSMAGGDFMKNETNTLDCDLLVVDEASMIDQILFHHLLKAIPKDASVVFVGDVDQLPSVGPGNVLKDIIDSGVCPVVHLKEIFRQGEESMIVVNAHKINSGEMPCFDDKSNGTSPCDFYFIEQNDPDKALEIIKELVTLRIPQKFGFDPVKDIQVLTPMHRGSVGTTRLNSELREVLNIQHGSKVQRMGRIVQEGDKVMQIRNNYEKDVYNGDIGTVLRIDGEESKVIVEMDSGRVSYDFSELDELIHAYAVSIHKSQGSEYPAVVIPIMTQHYMMLQRNLLYTGITRGKKLVVLVGTKKAVAIAVKNDKTRKRYTRLAGRLKDCLKG
ncbi:MAG: ATP-dependent RecD-like DNA helicase [Synergistaceae bacterium]|jgi:exodeoxyribonuclease V alpha subunit|nr:ATP-dependent RecD-like DNA helicase [Synergistaceae bacterium]MCE5183835.1 ATP-dependent RecD-like DNA helicase [Synergistaceae bacterium]MDD4751333.1 ATP-dependent RecD-like DNA helicase [Synergistaceae bacterium]PKL04396.1 MAG: ATP-dependent RecD-like DNA helicase [Synergistetes bacterium HGW-Synergistetes-1]